MAHLDVERFEYTLNSLGAASDVWHSNILLSSLIFEVRFRASIILFQIISRTNKFLRVVIV